MDVRTGAFRIPTSAVRYDATHVRPGRIGVPFAIWLATQIPSRI